MPQINWDEPKLNVNPAFSSDIIDTEKSYLITGGLSGMGLQAAKRLIKYGVKNIILLSRSGARSIEAKMFLHKCAQKEINLLTPQLDIADSLSVLELKNEIEKNFPKIAGIYQCAGVIDDKLSHEMERESFDRVFRPKILGVLNLHNHFKEHPVKFFVCFSSITSIIGNRGQANYAAANGFLDGFSKYRTALGLPSLTINWGPISGTGLLINNEKAEKILRANGIYPIHINDALDIMEHLIVNKVSNIGAFQIDWNKWRDMEKSASKSSFFAKSLISMDEGKQNSFRGFIADLDNVQKTGGDLVNFSVLKLKKELKEVLKTDLDSIDSKRPLNEIGVDSLMGVEFASNVQNNLGLEISSMDIMKGISLGQLATKILGQIKKFDQKTK